MVCGESSVPVDVASSSLASPPVTRYTSRPGAGERFALGFYLTAEVSKLLWLIIHAEH